jgi:pimeloyl-ACP methyl ester carboxylesterase
MAPEHFADGSPLELLPLGARQLVIHGEADDSVAYEMSRRYVAAAAPEAELITLAGAGHFEPIDPQAPQFAHTLAAIQALL